MRLGGTKFAFMVGKSHRYEAHRFPHLRQDSCIFPPNLGAHRTLDWSLNNLMKEQGHQQLPLTSLYISCFFLFLSLTTYNTLFCKHILVPPKKGFNTCYLHFILLEDVCFELHFNMASLSFTKSSIFFIEVEDKQLHPKKRGTHLEIEPHSPSSCPFYIIKGLNMPKSFPISTHRQNIVEAHKVGTSTHHSTTHSFNLLCLKNLESQ